MQPSHPSADRPNPSGATPDREPAARAAAPERITRLLILVRWIIGYGTGLANTIHQRATQPEFRSFAMRYRKGDFTIIVARIKRGLLLAAGLEAKLAARAAKGHDLAPLALRMPSLPARPSDTAPGAGEGGEPRTARRTAFIDRPLDRLPTAEEIGEELRRRPIGAILVDICRDLGLMPGEMSGEHWQELRSAVIDFGGQLAKLMCAESNAWQHDNWADLMSGRMTGYPAPAISEAMPAMAPAAGAPAAGSAAMLAACPVASSASASASASAPVAMAAVPPWTAGAATPALCTGPP